MAGRHRRPPAWRRALTGRLGGRSGVRAARSAALLAEVIALRVTVASLRADLDTALAGARELAALLAVASAPPAALDLPLVRLALSREAEPALTREMALALAAPDRGPDSANVRIVLGDLPERALLDPLADRDGDLRDLAAHIAAVPETFRRSA